MENSENNTVISGKLNPLFILINLISALPALALLIISVAFSEALPGDALQPIVIAVIIGFFLLMGLLVLYWFIYYKYFTYYLDASQFTIKKGFIFKKQEHLAYQKIQNVGQTATLLHRLFGLCDLKVESAGGSGNTSLILHCVKKNDAEILRRELFARKNYALRSSAENITPEKPGEPCEVSAQACASTGVGAKASNILDVAAGFAQEIESDLHSGEVYTGDVKFEQGLGNKDLLLASLGANQAVFFKLFLFAGFVFSLPSFILSYLDEHASAAAFYIAELISSMNFFAIFSIAIIAVLAAVLIAGLVTFISNALSFGGFVVRRKDQRIEVERGVIKRVYDGVDIDKIQYIRIHQSLIHRMFKGCKIIVGKVESAEGASSVDPSFYAAGFATPDFCVCPFIAYTKATAFMHSLAPELQFDIPVTENLPSPALRKAIFRKALLYNPAVYIALFAIAVYVLIVMQTSGEIADIAQSAGLFSLNVMLALSALVTIWQIIDAVLWYKGSGYGIKGSRIAIKNSGFDVNEEYFAKNKIQNITLNSTPFQRRSNTCTACIRCAAGIGGATTKLYDLRRIDGEVQLIWFKPGKQNV